MPRDHGPWVIDIPIAIALGFDEPRAGLMGRAPRAVGAPVLSARNWIRLCGQGLVMTVTALVAYKLGEPHGPEVASTMLLTALSLSHLAAGLLTRDERNTLFDRAAVPASAQLRRYGIALLAVIAVTTIELLQRIFGTTDLDFGQWSICVAAALALILVDEIVKIVIRWREHRHAPAVGQPAVGAATAQ